MRRKSHLPIIAVAALALAACSEDAEVTEPAADAVALSRGGEGHQNADGVASRLYRVTVENLTGGQPFSPGVVATHTKAAHVFQVGAPASEGVRLIAENGMPETAVTELTGVDAVFEVKAFPDPLGPIIAGASGSIQIAASANANRLSLVIMLICTNDGFTGLESVKLPGGFQPAVYYSNGYDAGTEVNTEKSKDIVDACGAAGPVALPADGNARTAEGSVIGHHAGIQGIADLVPAQHGWEDPVAKITIQRIE
jgi:hypothetical protein